MARLNEISGWIFKKVVELMRAIYRVFLVVLLLISPIMVLAEVAEPEVQFNAASLRPGDFLQIKVKASDDALVKVGFLERGYELWKNEKDEFIGFLPISYYNAPGDYQVSILVKSRTLDWVKTYPIKVLGRTFPESRISVPESTRKKVLSNSSVNSDAKITTKARLEAIESGILSLWEGPFIWPVKGRISTGFGRIRYVNNAENGRHSGIDIVSPEGTPVLAVNRGRVIYAGNLNVTGLTVMLHHGLNLFTSYCHLSVIAVNQGDQVEKGTVLGKVGSTGLSTGPHLHLTFKIDEVSIDPELFLERTIAWDFPETN